MHLAQRSVLSTAHPAGDVLARSSSGSLLPNFLSTPWSLHTSLRIAIYTGMWAVIAHTMADPDLWGHLRFGLDILATHALPAHDVYSFTSDRVWVNHEWLSEVLMGIAYTFGGIVGLNLLKIAAIGIIAATVFRVAMREPAPAATRDALVCLTIVGTFTRTMLIRPQLFSVALFCVVLYLIKEVDRGRVRAIWGLPICFALWVNLHGGWIVGLGMVGIWFAGAILERRGARVTVMLVAAGLATLAATLINPYGIGLWGFLRETVGMDRPFIADWQPLLSQPAAILLADAILPLVALAAIVRARSAVPLRYVAMLLMLVAATLKVGRIDAFAEAAIAILLAPQILAGSQRDRRSIGGQLRYSSPVLRAAAVLLLGGALIAATWQIHRISLDTVPVDSEATIFLRDRAPGARVLTWFNWGQYALWHLSPSGIRVSMDGRRETVYSDDVITRHLSFYRADMSLIDYPDRIGADYIWLPTNLPVIGALRFRGWHVVYESPYSIVLSRTPRATVVHSEMTLARQRAFPGP